MKNVFLWSPFIVIVMAANTCLGALSSSNPCPDLAGNYKTQDGAPFSISSIEYSNGTAEFTYVTDKWIADGKARDNHSGELNPAECPSTITCENKILTRSYVCSGFKSSEVYSLQGGDVKVVGTGMGLNGTQIYKKAK